MSELHNLLDGDLSDNDTVALLKSLVNDIEKRETFRQQMKLQGALQRNETFNALSSGEEAEMLARLSAAVGITTTTTSIPWTKRLSKRAWSMVAGALLVGSGLGYAGYGVANDNVPGAITPTANIPALAMATSPCNCDSVAAVQTAAVRDSVVRSAKPTEIARKPAVRKHRGSIEDPTGRNAALRMAAKSKRPSSID